jgi:hypothetical protein
MYSYTYKCYVLINKLEITTARTNRVTFNVQNIYVMGIRRHLWEQNDEVDRTAHRKGGRGLGTLAMGQRQEIISCENCNKSSISTECSDFINFI